MATKAESETVGSQNGLSESDVACAAGVLEIAGEIKAIVAGKDNRLEMLAALQSKLRDGKERAGILDAVVEDICPEGVVKSVWLGWMNGEESPFPKKLKKTGPGEEYPAKTLQRSTPRVSNSRKKVERLKAELEEAESELLYNQNFERAALHYHVVAGLLEIVQPIFAMGPAWTLMRSVSTYLNEDEIKTELLMSDVKDTPQGRTRVLEPRHQETKEMMAVLDALSGNRKFEAELRDAVKSVCDKFGKEIEKHADPKRRPRSEEKLRTEPHPNAIEDADDVLAGLPKIY